MGEQNRLCPSFANEFSKSSCVFLQLPAGGPDARLALEPPPFAKGALIIQHDMCPSTLANDPSHGIRGPVLLERGSARGDHLRLDARTCKLRCHCFDEPWYVLHIRVTVTDKENAKLAGGVALGMGGCGDVIWTPRQEQHYRKQHLHKSPFVKSRLWTPSARNRLHAVTNAHLVGRDAAQAWRWSLMRGVGPLLIDPQLAHDTLNLEP